jgi:hypothetical protein
MSQDMRRSPLAQAVTSWELITHDIGGIQSRISFKHSVRKLLRGEKNTLATTKLQLPRVEEINLNRTRCDFIFKSHTCMPITSQLFKIRCVTAEIDFKPPSIFYYNVQ